MNSSDSDWQNVISFWFHELKPIDWFSGGTALDEKIEERFFTTLQKAKYGELFTWRKSTEGRLAEIIVLDQFSRNIYRGTSEAFAQDGIALTLAQEMVELGLDKHLDISKRNFAYMPFMHSESQLIHQQAEKLFNQIGLENSYRYEMAHKNIIDQFGRYPHRNEILGRVSTAEEIEFLKKPGSAF